MLVQGGKYDGWQLGAVAKEDPIAASLMLNNYLEGKRAAVEKESTASGGFSAELRTGTQFVLLQQGQGAF